MLFFQQHAKYRGYSCICVISMVPVPRTFLLMTEINKQVNTYPGKIDLSCDGCFEPNKWRLGGLGIE